MPTDNFKNILHEARGPPGRPRSESRRRSDLLPLRKDEDKPARTTRSGKKC